MNRTETNDLLRLLLANFRATKFVDPKDLEITSELYYTMLKDYDSKEVFPVAKKIIATRKIEFLPPVAVIIDEIHSLREEISPEGYMSEAEAWALVRKCTAGNMEYEKLPEDVKQAIGPAKQVEDLGREQNVNWDVELSLFSKRWKTVQERKKELARTPKEVREMLRLATSNIEQIEVKNE